MFMIAFLLPTQRTEQNNITLKHARCRKYGFPFNKSKIKCIYFKRFQPNFLLKCIYHDFHNKNICWFLLFNTYRYLEMQLKKFEFSYRKKKKCYPKCIVFFLFQKSLKSHNKI